MKGERQQRTKKTPTTLCTINFFVYRIQHLFFFFFWLFCNLDQMIRVSNNSAEPLKIYKMCLIEKLYAHTKRHTHSIAHRPMDFFLFTGVIFW